MTLERCSFDGQIKIVVTSTARDALGLARLCAESVAKQSDRGVEWVHRYRAFDSATLHALDGVADVCELSPQGQIVNLWEMWKEAEPGTIIVWLDGDDELTPGALERVASYYALREDVWLTYGSFVSPDGRPDHLRNPCFGRRYQGHPRRERWRASHLRTFRRELVDHLPFRELLDETTGQPFEFAIDVAVMTPLIELCGENYFVSTDVNCVYHVEHASETRDPNGTRAAEERVCNQLARRGMMPPIEEL